mgnify:FL=1|jgi:hypothetical protein
MENYSIRFIEVLDALKLTGYKLNGIGKITKQKISNIKNDITEVKTDVLSDFCIAFPQVNANYILTGRGSMFLENEISALSEERKEDDSDVSLTYDELSRLHKTTVLRYERLFKNLKSEFEKLEETIVKADGELNKALEDVRVVIKKQKTA